MTKRWLALLLGCLALALVAAGCGGDDDDNGGGGGGGQQQAPAATSGGGQVTMKDIKFNPGTVTIKAGGKVTWTNDDSVGHDVTADDFKSGSPGGIEGGSTFSHVFKKAGTYDYVCSVHPGMEGTVKVK